MITQSDIRKMFSYSQKTGILRWKIKPSKKVQIGDEAGSINSEGYIQVSIHGILYYAHRLIWLGVYGYLPEHDIDHKNRIRHHNWLSNLRETSHQCNLRNTGNPKDNTSGVKGISFDKSRNKWRVRITINQKLNHIGSFVDFDEAVCHRLAAEQCLDWNKCDSNSPAFQYVKENIQNEINP